MAQVGSAQARVVRTGDGRVEGTEAEGVMVFRGIPYAAPPVGALRWRAPQPMKPWRGIKPAVEFGSACVQKVAKQDPEKSLENFPQSEDCLTLNVWSPKARQGVRLPVMVWIHGGSFRFGAGSLSTYDGSALAQRGVVVVTINYRLGLFGTFAHPTLQMAGEPDGNYGLLDAIAALRWVRRNAGSFGGDANSVTLFGESAGGVSVGYLMASPLAAGLFDRAIIQSGGLYIPELSKRDAQAVAARVAEELGAHNAAELRALSAMSLRDANTSAGETMPFIDGTVVREKTHEAFTAGRTNRFPLLIGYNDAEAGFFGPGYWKGLPSEVGQDGWNRLSSKCFGYGGEDTDSCAEQTASELFAGVNSRRIARGASRQAPVWMYRFSWLPSRERGPLKGAIHTAEIPYVFGHIAAGDRDRDDGKSQTLSSQIMERWIGFARTGRPELRAGDWPRYLAGNDERVKNFDGERNEPALNPADALLDELERSALPARP
ncbi:carboxylesterase/lipase family protein [Sphingobium sp. AP50]|uniref:carboxylesterase/lipase family protein n=1 Tax=Sphingobium sp. AP50 TaxID=1884369 RepID=UPI00210A9FB6|nr:carboxylesterase family protein [Sphingobium sp. AP50]